MLDKTKTSKRASIQTRRPKKLRPELREFLDACVIPALVEKYLAKHKERR
jgi:hypothetical protein